MRITCWIPWLRACPAWAAPIAWARSCTEERRMARASCLPLSWRPCRRRRHRDIQQISSAQCCKFSKLLHLVIKPLTCLRGTWLSRSGTKRVQGSAVRVEARARIASWQGLGATIRFSGCLQPEVGIHKRRRGYCRRSLARPGPSSIAPTRTVLTRVGDPVPSSVNDHMCFHAQLGAGSHDELLCIVELVVAGIPLGCQAAGVTATRIIAMPSVQAIAVAGAVVGLMRTQLSKGLVVGNVGRKTTDLVHGQTHAPQRLHEVD
mmetsp:Transcript_39374/g.94308  ORF Transcript_39374/g.94308 Transcript_39374/m.94308 type:complete len:262 (-) Transcript_39374:976-1761(-)